MASPPDARHDAPAMATDGPPQRLVAYVSGYGPDIAWFDVDPHTGALAASGQIAAFAPSPSFLAIAPGASALYAVSEANSRIGAYAIDPASGSLHYIDDAASGGQGPAYVGVDPGGKFVLAANYTDGSAAVLAMQASGGVVDPPRQTIAPGQNAHMIVTDPSDRYVFVPCLGSDYVAQYTFDAQAGTLAANGKLTTAAGAGPRHLAFAPDATHAYLIDEKASTVMALALDAATGQLTALQTIATVPAGTTGNTGAEVAVHPSGAYLYASNRGDNTIARFAIAADATLTLLDRTPTQGATPRSFTIGPGGRFLYVANQGGNSVVTFAIAADGSLAQVGAPITADQPTFVGIVAL